MFYDVLWCSMIFYDVLRCSMSKEHFWFPFVWAYLWSCSGHFLFHRVKVDMKAGRQVIWSFITGLLINQRAARSVLRLINFSGLFCGSLINKIYCLGLSQNMNKVYGYNERLKSTDTIYRYKIRMCAKTMYGCVRIQNMDVYRYMRIQYILATFWCIEAE